MTTPDGHSTRFYNLADLPLTAEGKPATSLDPLAEEVSQELIDAVLEKATELIERVSRPKGFPVRRIEAISRIYLGEDSAFYHLELARTDGGWTLNASRTQVQLPLLDRSVASQIGANALKQVLGPVGAGLWNEYLEKRLGNPSALSEADIFDVADWLLDERRIEHEQYHQITVAVAKALAQMGV